MLGFVVAIINGSCMFRLQSSQHQTVYIRNIKGNHVPVVYMQDGSWLVYITAGGHFVAICDHKT